MTEASSSSGDSPTGGYGKIAGLYDLEQTLGSGHFAVVKLARHVFTGAKVAVKVVDKTKLDEVSKAHLFQEVRCMKLVQHPNVVRLYEVIDTQTKLYLVLELGDGGDLYDYIMRHEGGLDEDLARKYFRQILRAITYCHELHVVHRDLKPANVVFFEKLGVVKLTDFGFSNKFQPGEKLETFCGSLAYSAPEILLGDSYDAPAVDIWSLGVILYMLVCGQLPFEKANDSETLTMIMDCKYTVPLRITEECRQLIAKMLVRDPKKRATLEEIAAHPWVTEGTDEDTADFYPLMSREQLTDEDHTFIIQKMINGQIASKEDIVQALDKSKYNHITATYYLLAEIRLRKHREEEAQKAALADACNSSNGDGTTRMQTEDNKNKVGEGNKLVPPVAINVSAAAPNSNDQLVKTDKRSRKCSIVREEDEDESAYENADGGNELRVTITRRESISDGRINRSVQERTVVPIPIIVQSPRNKMMLSVDAKLAQKLNRIDVNSGSEAQIASNVNKSTAAMQDTLKNLKELEIGKLKPLPSSGKDPVLTHRRTKLNKIRTPSCSSSEASDDDTKTRNKKKMNKFVGDNPTRFRMHRRDSYDDSSDSQDQAFSSAGSRANANIITANNNSNVSGKKDDGQSQGKDQRHSDDNRKSSSSGPHTHKSKKQPKDSYQTTLSDKDQQHLLQLESKLLLNNGGGNNNTSSMRRRRVRESQSLDRITEAQEYELRHRHCNGDKASAYISNQRNSLSNLSSFSVAETNEEYDYYNDERDNSSAVTAAIPTPQNVDLQSQVKNALNLSDTSVHLSHLQLKRNKHNIYNISSISELDLILEDKNFKSINSPAPTSSSSSPPSARQHSITTTKAIHVAGTKCFVTIKKIRRLGKYFPVVNFS